MTYPTKGTQPCFGQRQDWCKNTAIWRMETRNLVLHFCEECKNRENIQNLAKGGSFIEMPAKEAK